MVQKSDRFERSVTSQKWNKRTFFLPSSPRIGFRGLGPLGLFFKTKFEHGRWSGTGKRYSRNTNRNITRVSNLYDFFNIWCHLWFCYKRVLTFTTCSTEFNLYEPRIDTAPAWNPPHDSDLFTVILCCYSTNKYINARVHQNFKVCQIKLTFFLEL